LGDILFVNGGVTVQSSGNISLNAGDSLFIDAGATVTAAANVTLRGDFGNADPAAGATIEIRGTINNGGAATVLGNGDADTISLFRKGTGPITIDSQG